MNFKSLAARALLLAAVAGTSVAALAEPTMKVGATPTGAPFTFLNTGTGKIDGVMVDVVRAIGKEAGFDVQVEPLLFSALIGSLTSKRIDMISAAMYITPAREQIVSFSKPVFQYGEGVLVPQSDTHNYKSFADMKGMVVGAQVGTTQVDAMQKSGVFKEIKLYESGADMLSDLKAGRVQAVVFDNPIMVYNEKKGNYPGMRVVDSYVPTQIGKVGIAMQKGDPAMLAKVNAAIDKLKANGTLDAIYKKWGVTPAA